MYAAAMLFALPITFAVVPALLLLWFFHSRDAYPEPPRVVWATFFLGVLSIPAVLLVALPAKHLLHGITNPYQYGLADAFVCAAIPEEFFKFVVLTGYAARHSEFNEPMDGVVYGVAASLGFATLENILYVGSGGLGVGLMRAFSAVPGHAFTGVVMGYYVGRARFARPELRGALYGLALLGPMLLHGMYDFPLLVIAHYKRDLVSFAVPDLAALLVLVTLLTLILEWRLALRLVRRLRAEQDAERGVVPAIVVPAIAVAPAAAEPAAAVKLAPEPGPAAVWDTALAAPAAKSFSWAGWAQVLCGGVLLTGAGLFLMLIGIGVASGETRPDAAALLVGTAVSCGVPILLGVWLFRRGIRCLNRA